MDFETAFENYLRVNIRIQSDQTKKHYRIFLRRFSEFLQRPPELSDLDDETAAAFVSHMITSGRTIPTANQKLCYLVAFWNWAAKKRIVEKFPTIKQLDEPDPDTTTWSDDEIQHLFEACDNLVGNYAGVPRSIWWRAYIAFSLETGERTSAVLQLPKIAIDWKTGHVMVPANLRKGRRKKMHYVLRDEVLRLSNEVRAHQTHPVLFHFPTKEDRPIPTSFYNHFRRLLELAGLPSDRKRFGQCLRRRHVNWVIIAADLSAGKRALGHSTSRITSRYYEDRTKTETQPISDMLPNFLTEQNP